jgi:PD-(D/E)XK nuclease superfamily
MDNIIEINDILGALAAKIPQCDTEHVHAEKHEAPRFSAFNLLGTRETALSRVLAELLDPRGSHGQGVLFLNALLQLIGCEAIQPLDRNVRVQTEAPVPIEGNPVPRRIDILVETPTLLLGIENKKWTGESSNQLRDYGCHLKKTARENQTCKLIFISNDEPSEGVAAIQFPYHRKNHEKTVEHWLQSVRKDIQAKRVGNFIDDFIGWIQREFSEDSLVPMTTYNNFISNFMQENPSNARALAAVLTAQDVIVSKYIQSVEKRLRECLEKEFNGIEVSCPDHPGDYDCLLDMCLKNRYRWWAARKPSWPKGCYIAISTDSGHRKGIFYGIVALNPDSVEGKKTENERWRAQRFAKIDDVANSYAGRDGKTDWWPWHKVVRTPDWSGEAIGQAMLEGEASAGDRLGVGQVLIDLIVLGKAIDQISS